MAVLPGVLECSFDRLRTGSPCDVPFRYASEPAPCGCPARGASACAARGTPIFVVSRQQFMKYPGKSRVCAAHVGAQSIPIDATPREMLRRCKARKVMGMLDAIYNHSIKKLPVTAGKLGELDPHSTGRNRVIRPMHIYPDYFGINRKTTI